MSSQVYAAPSTAPKRRRARARFGGGALGAVLGAFSVLGLFVAFPLSADQPGADASAAKAVAYWSSHSDKQMVAAAIFAVATGRWSGSARSCAMRCAPPMGAASPSRGSPSRGSSSPRRGS